MDASDELKNRVSHEPEELFCCQSPSKADARRDRLLEAARSLFAERGFHSTGVAQIAKTSGVLVGQIYRDFANKEEIVAAIVARDLEASLAEDELARAAEAGDSAAIRVWIRGFVLAKLEKDCRLSLEIMAESVRNPRIAATFRDIQQRIRCDIARALAALAPGAERERDRAVAAEVIMAIGGGIFHLRAADGSEIDPQVAERLAALVDREVDALIAG